MRLRRIFVTFNTIIFKRQNIRMIDGRTETILDIRVIDRLCIMATGNYIVTVADRYRQ